MAAEPGAEGERAMTEPVYKWEPATEEYKAKAIQQADIEAEVVQRLEETRASRKLEKKETAPLGIRLFIWYYFFRAVVCAVGIFIVAGFPQSTPTTWLTANVADFLKLPGSRVDEEARKKRIEKMAQEYAVPENAISELGRPKVQAETLSNLVIAYLVFTLGISLWVGFGWLNRSWRIRWVTMFYAGALIAKVFINILARVASGAGTGIDPSQTPTLVLTLGVNALVFLYLSFGYGVKDWFEPGSTL